ncbi:hypothetical protein [Paraburkholderia fynbosensis]|uniref:Uncharacterized protein n=1 Tax=Paraburkholderia fynbosensis TaxID=1200993 RepID=A0A6J5FES5_9BURK|nr:hypothetical protein [Paraburkholderia fynbosensis]CAB3778133.1 hypothetical protein LMG27177_00536 [Paraburkholderia fynbosensis]
MYEENDYPPFHMTTGEPRPDNVRMSPTGIRGPLDHIRPHFAATLATLSDSAKKRFANLAVIARVQSVSNMKSKSPG